MSATINLGAGAAAKLVIVTEPSSTARSGQEFNTQPVVRLLDAWDNLELKSGITVTATLNSGIGSLRGDRTENTNSQGVADFDDLEIQGVGTFTIRFSATGLTSVVSAAITVSPELQAAGSRQQAAGKPLLLLLPVACSLMLTSPE